MTKKYSRATLGDSPYTIMYGLMLLVTIADDGAQLS